MTVPVVMLIDGHSMAFRAFYALPVESFRTATGQFTNAVHGFTSMLINLLRDYQPTHLAVCFDHSKETFRTAQYPEYKGTRQKTPEEFLGQIELITELLDALGIAHLDKEGVEADDLIATLSTASDARAWQTLIVSGDRDSFQLVNDRVTVLYPVRGVSELAQMTPAAIEAKYGVSPQRYRELAALVGESSDNLPGVPGVGPKTAAKWLAEYDGLDNLLARADQVRGKAGQSLRDHLDDVQRNNRLNLLLRDVDLPIDLDGLERAGADREAAHRVFDALEFRTLRERWFATFGSDQAEMPAQTPQVACRALEAGELADWLAEHAQGVTGVELRGEFTPGGGDVWVVVLAGSDDQVCWLDRRVMTPGDEQAWTSWLADDSRQKVMHGAKPQRLAARALGWRLAGLRCDTEVAAYLLRPDQRSYPVDDLAMRYLHLELRGDQPVPAQAPLDFGGDQEEEYRQAGLRARVLIDLAEALRDELAEADRLLDEVELPLQRVLSDMEARGIAVDGDELDRLYAAFDARVLQAQAGAWQAAGREVNLASPKQLQDVLFNQLDLPRTKKIKSGYTTDAEALEMLYDRTGHPFLAHLLAHRDAIKLRQSVEGLRKAVQDDGRIHTTFLQTIAATGRLSSADPNLQNIPIRTQLGRQIRAAFVAGQGFGGLMSADYSQIEMRVMAHASGDDQLIAAFRSGADFHTITAARVFRISPEEVTPDQRSSVKQMNYGLAYGLSAYGLSGRLGVSVGEAKELMADYFATFGEVQRYLADIVDQARQTGYTETILGRRRYLPDLTSSSRRLREMAERAALNAPIQGSAADIIKLAMLRTDDALRAAGARSCLLLQIHDELLLEIAPGEREQVEQIVRTQMGGAVELSVPLDVSVGFGPNWLAAAH